MYLEAKKIILVMDNLDTHKPSSLYKDFKPKVARRIIKKLEKLREKLNAWEIERNNFSLIIGVN